MATLAQEKWGCSFRFLPTPLNGLAPLSPSPGPVSQAGGRPPPQQAGSARSNQLRLCTATCYSASDSLPASGPPSPSGHTGLWPGGGGVSACAPLLEPAWPRGALPHLLAMALSLWDTEWGAGSERCQPLGVVQLSGPPWSQAQVLFSVQTKARRRLAAKSARVWRQSGDAGMSQQPSRPEQARAGVCSPHRPCGCGIALYSQATPGVLGYPSLEGMG